MTAMFISVILPRQVFNDSTGSFYEVPVLHSDGGHFDALLDYCIENRAKSNSWMRKLVFDVQLLLNYMHVNPNEQNSELLFQNFASKLQTGTFNPLTGHDPSQLGWLPRSPYEAQQTITRVSNFLDSLSKKDPSLAKVNPTVALSPAEKHLRDCADIYRRKYALLGHIWTGSTNEDRGKKVRGKGGPKVTAEPPAFPEDRFEELMERGFIVGGRTRHRDQAITLLMHGAGFRISEPMHLYIGDVTRDPTDYRKALVRIHHPTLGEAPRDLVDERGRPIRCSRQEYLQRKFGLAPRIDLMSKKEAGWKGIVLDEKYYMRPYWFRPDYAERFREIWDRYMEDVADIPLRMRNHPYAFMNIYREPKGSILSLDKFVTAHGRACERIGLRVEKQLGTTLHGHRHAYGRRLSNAGIEPSIIKKCMHHSTEQSQEVYTSKTTQEVLTALDNGLRRMQSLTHPQPF